MRKRNIKKNIKKIINSLLVPFEVEIHRSVTGFALEAVHDPSSSYMESGDLKKISGVLNGVAWMRLDYPAESGR